MSFFVPKDWKLTDKLRQYARDRRVTDGIIDEQLEDFRLCQFKRSIKDFDRAWMRWIRFGIKKGWIPTVQEPKYRTIEEQSPEEKLKSNAQSVAQMAAYRRGR